MAIDDFSSEFSAAILPDKAQYSATRFLEQAVKCPYTIEVWYTDNSREFVGNPKPHVFMRLPAIKKLSNASQRRGLRGPDGKAKRAIQLIREM